MMLSLRRFNRIHKFIRHIISNSAYMKCEPEFDLEYLCNEKNFEEINENIIIRKGVGDITEVLKLNKLIMGCERSNEHLKQKFKQELLKIPNKTDPRVKDLKDEPKLLHCVNEKPSFGDFKPWEFSDITKRLNLMRTDRLGHTSGSRSYYFMSDLAEMEEALIKYTVNYLLDKNFRLISVPDILPSHILTSCGMQVNNNRTQIFSLDSELHGPDLFLSGTSEMALAGLLTHTTHQEDNLPLRLVAVSRCYRAETSNMLEQRGIYRTYQFTKVEMFAVTSENNSDTELENFRKIEEELFRSLGFHFRVLDMPPKELGAPAFRKYDIEAWLPGRNVFGEISSCSNCTDYQSRRLHIKYVSNAGKELHAHTLNGTACAIPRMLIALLETHQTPKGVIKVPGILQPFMSGKQFIKRASVPELKLYKATKKTTK